MWQPARLTRTDDEGTRELDTRSLTLEEQFDLADSIDEFASWATRKLWGVE